MNTTQNMTHEQVMAAYERLDQVRDETNALARHAARSLALGCDDEARRAAQQFVDADDQRFTDLMALSAATHKLCEIES